MLLIAVKSYTNLVKLIYLGFTLLLSFSTIMSHASEFIQTEELNIQHITTSEDTLREKVELSETYWLTDKSKSDSIINLAFKIISRKGKFPNQLLGDAYHMMGKVLINNQEFKSGIDSLKVALQFKQNVKKPDYESLAKTANYIGRGFLGIQEFDSAIYFCNNSKQILVNNNIYNIDLYYSNLNIAIAYSRLGRIDNAINYFDTAYIALNKSDQANDSIVLASFYYNYALIKTVLGQLKEANEYFEKTEIIIRSKFGDSNINLAGVNNNKGINSYYDYDFSKAALYYKKALDIYIINKTGEDKIPLIYGNLSQVSQDTKDYLSSINYCLSGLEYDPGNDLRLSLNKNIAQSYASLDNIDKANTYFEIALNLLNKESVNPIRKQELYSSYADFLLENNNKLSIVYLKKALKSAKVNGEKESDSYAEILTKTGIYYLNLEKNADIAISYFKRSIAIYEEKEGDNVLANNNIIEKKKALVGYAAALILKYNSTNQINLLYKADTIFANELNKMNDVSNSLAYSDKLLLIEIADPLYNLAIKNSNDILKLTENKIYANKVFNYTERSKSSALLSAVAGEHALKTSDIPIETFNFEHQLKDEINGLQQLLENEKTEDEPIVANIGFFERKLLILINKYDSLIVDIEDKYPKYYSVKYGTEAISPKQVKQNLNNDEAILEYKLTDSVLYIITITNNDFNVSSIEVDSSFYNSLDYIVSIKSVNLSEENFKKFNDFKYHSNYLWQYLIESSNSLIENKRLIIIPDGILGYLPFDLLIENNNISDSINYRDLPYLIRSHPISYAYSATLKYNTYFNAKSDIPKNSILAFAPLYRGSKLNKNSTLLPPLPFAKEEALKIVASRGGEVFVDDDATKSNFLKYASSNNILHLAMHTIINDSLPMQSKLVFYSDEDDDVSSSYMFTHELYNMNLNASMVVLSACNTGTGDLKKGEGIMSLARGFVYSGVPSIVMTLWEVQDASGSLIMNMYYDYLNAGNSKDFALQQAKLSVLKNANMAKAHPFFWSTYIISGDTSAMILTNEDSAHSPTNFYWIFAILAVLFVAIFLFYRLKKHPVQVS